MVLGQKDILNLLMSIIEITMKIFSKIVDKLFIGYHYKIGKEV